MVEYVCRLVKGFSSGCGSTCHPLMLSIGWFPDNLSPIYGVIAFLLWCWASNTLHILTVWLNEATGDLFVTRRTLSQPRRNKPPFSNHTYTKSTPNHIHHHYAPFVTLTHTPYLHLYEQTPPE